MTVHNQKKKRVGEIYPSSWIWAGLTFLIFFDPSRITGSKSTCRCFAMHRGEQYSKPDVNLWAKDLTTFLSLWWFFHMAFFVHSFRTFDWQCLWRQMKSAELGIWPLGFSLNQGCSPFCWNAHLPVSSESKRGIIWWATKRGNICATLQHTAHTTHAQNQNTFQRPGLDYLISIRSQQLFNSCPL